MIPPIKFRWLPKDPDYALVLPLVALCLLLLLGLTLQSFSFRRSAGDVPGSTTTSAVEPANLEAGDDASFELPGSEEFADFVEHPLFVEGRKPIPEDEQKQAAEVQDTTPLDLKLMGVLFSPSGEMAILAERTGKNRRVRKGSTLSGWRLAEVHTDHVTLQRGDERRDLPLLKPKPKTASAPGQAGVPGQPQPPGGVAGKRPGRPPPPEGEGEGEDPDAEDMEDSGENEDGSAAESDAEESGEETPESEE